MSYMILSVAVWVVTLSAVGVFVWLWWIEQNRR